MLKNTQLASEGYRLTKQVKIPKLRVPLAILAVIADIITLYLSFLCHITYNQQVISRFPIKQF
jgi:hypothetical protein